MINVGKDNRESTDLKHNPLITGIGLIFITQVRLCSVFTWVNYTLDKSANFEGYRYEKLYYDSTTRINSTAHSRAKAMH